jgi:glycosyltransferase involved in cell wall biosynthesis
MIKISCIIPAYNEAKRIGNVLDIISIHPNIDEIIVVDDASADNTKEVISKYENIKLIVHTKNEGKSKAIYDGILNSSGNYLLFVDADLVGLNEKNITDLILPIENGQADVSISLRKNAPRLWNAIGLDYISGERLLPKEMFDGYLEKILNLPKFGLEVFLNNLIIKRRFRIKIVNWPNVLSPLKAQKYGKWIGIKGDIFMIFDMIRTVSPISLFYQIIRMKKLSVTQK